MLLTHATLATMTDGYGLIPDAAVAVETAKALVARKLPRMLAQ